MLTEKTVVNVIPGATDERALKRAVLSAALLAAMSQVRVSGKALTGPKARELANDAAAQIFPDLDISRESASAPAVPLAADNSPWPVDLGTLEEGDATVSRCAGAIVAALRTCNTLESRRALCDKLGPFLENVSVSPDGAMTLRAIAPLANAEPPARPSALDPRD